MMDTAVSYFIEVCITTSLMYFYVAESDCDEVKCWYGAQCEVEAQGTLCVCPTNVSKNNSLNVNITEILT